jgi:ATP-binding cassette subfamily B protein/subfamily B ATP-binding cassette protein MsbA
VKSFWPLIGYARPHWRGLVLVAVTIVATVGLDVLRPWPTKVLVDNVLGSQPLDGWPGAILSPAGGEAKGLLVGVCVATVLIFAARAAIGMVSAGASVTLGQRMVYDLAADTFAHAQRLSLLFHTRRHVGDLVHRVTVDTYCLQVLIASTLLPLAQSVLTLGIMFVVMWSLEPRLTLISLSVVPLMGLLMWGFGGPMKELGRKRRDLEGRMFSLVEQTLGSIAAVQAFTREERERHRFEQMAQETIHAYRRSTTVDLWFKSLVGLVTAAGTAVIMWLGASYAIEGRVSVGTILVFLAYLACLYEPLNSVVYTASLMQYAAAGADRVRELLHAPLDVIDRADACDVALQGHVQLQSVTFGYEAEPVLRELSLEARPGEVVAIVGPTGAGKTTLVNLLVRFFDPWSGRVTIDGHDARSLKVRSLREQVALVLQDPLLLPLSVHENLAYGRPGASREEIIAAAIAANADAFIRQLPQGYDSVIGERGCTLSGGEKQRLAIARALLKNAPILILDEPTSALDARTEGQLLAALDRLMAGRTTFIIAHRLSTIRSADKIIVLDKGQIVEQGRHEELLEGGGLYATMYRQQMNLVSHDEPILDSIEAEQCEPS